MPTELPQSVRYVKNGAGGQWWKAAKAKGQLHAGWPGVPKGLLVARDLDTISQLPKEQIGRTQDYNALRTLLEKPSQYLWITIEDGFLWWCTVVDGVTANPDGMSDDAGHFWLTCDHPWTCTSLGGTYLATADLPGNVTATARFSGTIGTPSAANDVLRIIHDRVDPEVDAVEAARKVYERSVANLIRRLAPKDFELLVDLVLSRSGWHRIAKLGGSVEGIDVEVENAATEEIAFVQVKSQADQNVLDDYVGRFRKRRVRYARMIFAVHTTSTELKAPDGEPVRIWDLERIAHLVVRHGLASWLTKRF